RVIVAVEGVVGGGDQAEVSPPADAGVVEGAGNGHLHDDHDVDALGCVLDDPVESVEKLRARRAWKVLVGGAGEHHVVSEQRVLAVLEQLREPNPTKTPSQSALSKT